MEYRVKPDARALCSKAVQIVAIKCLLVGNVFTTSLLGRDKWYHVLRNFWRIVGRRETEVDASKE